jgi:endo-1,4-beta-xylanase
MLARRAALLALTLALATCTDTPTPAASAPSGAAASSAAATPASTEWTTLPVAELGGLVLGCIPGVERQGDKSILRAGDGYAGGVTRLRPWIQARGDFGIAATIGGDTESAADLNLIGTLARGAFWEGVKRLDIGLRGGGLAVSVYTGEKPEPSLSRSFPTPGVSRPAPVGMRKVGDELVFRVAGAEVGHLGLTAGPRTTMTISDLTVEAPPKGAGTVDVIPGFLDRPSPGTSLRTLATARSFRIGAFPDFIGADQSIGFLEDPVARRTLAREYNHLTVPIFPASVAPTRERYDFCVPDALVAFGHAHGMEMRVQTLVYTTPTWLRRDTFTSDELSTWMHGYISTVMGRYRGQIREWEVTNELFDFIPTTCEWNGKEGNTAFWVRSLPAGWVDQAFRWAHEADPQARLYYNENNSEGLGTKSDCVYAMAKAMKERGMPIDGVGMQAHWIIPELKQEKWHVPPPMESVAANMKRFADLGLSVEVTELDVLVGKDAGLAELAAQARVYGDLLRTCLAAGCSAFSTWGVSDRYSWIRGPQVSRSWERPLPFDESFRPKPAYDAMVDALRR